MLAQIIGPIDINAAIAIVAIALALCIVSTALIVKRRSRQVLNQEFELAKIKEANSQALYMYKYETERGTQFKKIEQGLITSHRSSTDE